MSAVPKPAALAIPEEELDLLISRALDSDLLPEEQALLDEILATNAAARARTAELAGTVDALHALPKLSPPFALATRVNARVRETEGGPLGIKLSVMRGIGSFAVAVMILFMAVTIIKKGQEDKKAEALVAQAKKAADDAPVNVPVFFSKDAAEQQAAAPSDDAPADAAKPSSEEPAKLAEAPARAEDVKERAAGKAKLDDRRDAESFAPETKLAKAEGPAEPQASKKQNEVAGLAAERDASPVAMAPPAPAAPAPAAPAGIRAQAAPDVSSAAAKAASASGEGARMTETRQAPAPPTQEETRRRARLAAMILSVSVVEPSGVRLVSPVPSGSLVGPIDDGFLLTVDASGRVSKVVMTYAPEQTVRPDVETLLRSLVFDVSGVRRKGADAPVPVQVRLLARLP
ncbi:MAG: hypothetical protein JNK60_16435 [Acidobacteria bacterium]|nr:hypothetical protein [Acidobacteriota bacterium]